MNNIAALRKYRGLSQSQLAASIGTTLNMLGKLEREERKLDLPWIEKIASALKVEPHEIIIPSGIIGVPEERPEHYHSERGDFDVGESVRFLYQVGPNNLGIDDDDISFDREAHDGKEIDAQTATVILLKQIDQRLRNIQNLMSPASKPNDH
ncbi:helix-turn-helix domain-containing protein [Novosphingobium barchaimii]|uniref:helix-turn-helix domain-containing protein n=1 Tax=Novosphingobium barchaimii TaxID=1420591 RepID=UPI0009E82F8D|nr:helix-turn-helix transcriptional regulator [Novosphingobium barchaimii]